LAFFDFSSLRTHFWLSTDVLQEIRRVVMRKNAEARVGGLCQSVADFGLPILSLLCGEQSSTAVLGVKCAFQDVEDELRHLIAVLRA
jgi:hypothetical protein